MATATLRRAARETVTREPVINDPLLTRTALQYKAEFFPYGFPARFRSNSRLVIDAAELSWGSYKRHFACAPLDVRLMVSESSSPALTEPPLARSQGHLLTIVGDAENYVCLDLRSGFSFGWVTPNTAASTGYFRQCFANVMVYPLIEVRHLLTIHAACVMFQGKGILLAGESGAGKSSLAYACARRGWTYVSDDSSAFVRDAETPLVIGHPQKFRFRQSVGELFPEFRGLKSATRAYGKPTIEIRTRELEHFQTADTSPIDSIVFLDRKGYRDGPPQLSRVSPDEAWKRLVCSVWAVDMPEYGERLAAVERLLDIPAYEMHYGDLGAAIDLLETLARGA